MTPRKSDIDAYRDCARAHYEGRDSAHDFRHIERILGRLDDLSAGLSPSRPLLLFLACFHGLAPSLRSKPAFRADTRSFLVSLGWAPEEIDGAFVALNRHAKSPASVEEELVHDANLLEVLGAFGIAKAFTTGGPVTSPTRKRRPSSGETSIPSASSPRRAKPWRPTASSTDLRSCGGWPRSGSGGQRS